MTRHLWVEKSRQVPSYLRCARVLNKRSAAQKANSNTRVSGRVLNKAKKPRSITYIYIYIYIYIMMKNPRRARVRAETRTYCTDSPSRSKSRALSITPPHHPLLFPLLLRLSTLLLNFRIDLQWAAVTWPCTIYVFPGWL